jgi:hypothetical protein
METNYPELLWIDPSFQYPLSENRCIAHKIHRMISFYQLYFVAIPSNWGHVLFRRVPYTKPDFPEDNRGEIKV